MARDSCGGWEVSKDPDIHFFEEHKDRQARIRQPVKMIEIDKQRGAHIVDELRGEFWSLGAHDKSRRRILVWKIPKDNPFFDAKREQLMRVPFLAFADEEIADRDDVLLPILHELMQDARKKQRR